MSDHISKVIYDELQLAVGSEVGGRIYPNHLPHASAVPAIRYFLLHAGERVPTTHGEIYLIRYQVDTIAVDLETVIRVQRLIFDHFANFSRNGTPNIIRAKIDYATWFQEIDVQMHRSITDISLHTDGV